MIKRTNANEAAERKNRIFTDLMFYGSSSVAIAAIFAAALTEYLVPVLIVAGTLYAIYAAAAVGFANRKDKFTYAIAGAITTTLIVMALLHATNTQQPLIWLVAKVIMVLVGAVFGVAIAKKFRRKKIWIALGALFLAFIVHFDLGEAATGSKQASTAQKNGEIYSPKDLVEDALFTLAVAVFCEILILKAV